MTIHYSSSSSSSYPVLPSSRTASKKLGVCSLTSGIRLPKRIESKSSSSPLVSTVALSALVLFSRTISVLLSSELMAVATCSSLLLVSETPTSESPSLLVCCSKFDQHIYSGGLLTALASSKTKQKTLYTTDSIRVYIQRAPPPPKKKTGTPPPHPNICVKATAIMLTMTLVSPPSTNAALLSKLLQIQKQTVDHPNGAKLPR